MVNINLVENHRVYILKKDKNPSVGTPLVADYYDFTDYLMNFSINKQLCKLATLNVTMAGIDTLTLRDYVKAGNYLFVMTGYNDGSVHNKLIGKFLLEKPIYGNKGSVSITGIQSSGKNTNNKQLSRTDNSYKKTFQTETLNTVFFGATGVCVDSNSVNVLDNGLDSSLVNNKISVDVDYNKRTNVVQKVCENANIEWDIFHGVNDSTNPFSAGDSLIIKSKIGTTSSSQHTFYLSGEHTNCYASYGVKSVSNLCNNVIIKGTDLAGDPIETNMFAGGVADSYIDTSKLGASYTSFDGWLYDDVPSYPCGLIKDTMDNGDTNMYLLEGVDYTITIVTVIPGSPNTVRIMNNGQNSTDLEVGESFTYFNDSYIYIDAIDVSGSPYTCTFTLFSSEPASIKISKGSVIGYHDGSIVFVKIDNEVIKGTVDDSSSLYTKIFNITRAVNTTTVMGSSTFPFDTERATHRKGSDVVFLRDGVASSGVLSVDVPLLSVTDLQANAGTIYIGSERCVNLATNHITNCVSVVRIDQTSSSTEADSWKGCYAHSTGIRILRANKSGGGYYTPDDPYPTSNIDNDGLFSEVFTDENSVTKDGLDKKCQLLLINRADIDDVVEIEPDNVGAWFTDINLGDAVSISGSSIINLEDVTEYRFVEYDYSWPAAKCKIYLNKIEKINSFNTKDNFTENFASMSNKMSNNSIRKNEFNNYTDISSAGEKLGFDFFNKEVNGINIDSDISNLGDDDTDKAVNVGLLKQSLSDSGANLWAESGSNLRPTSSGKSIFPNGSGNVGTSSEYWDKSYISEMYLHENYYFKHVAGTNDYLELFCNEENLSGSNPATLLQFDKGNLSLSSGYKIPRSYFKDSFIIPLTDESANVETVLQDTFTQEGSIYYDTATDKLRLMTESGWEDVGGDNSPLTTRGDIYIYSTTNARLAAGSNGQVLTADNTIADGLKWATPSSGFTDPMTHVGDIIYKDSSNITTRLPLGSSGKVLKSDGSNLIWGDEQTNYWELDTGVTPGLLSPISNYDVHLKNILNDSSAPTISFYKCRENVGVKQNLTVSDTICAISSNFEQSSGGVKNGFSFAAKMLDVAIGSELVGLYLNTWDSSTSALTERLRLDGNGFTINSSKMLNSLSLYSNSSVVPQCVIDTDGAHANGGKIYFKKERSGGSISDSDVVSQIQSVFKNSASELITASTIEVKVDDVTDGTEDTSVFISNMNNGIYKNQFKIAANEVYLGDVDNTNRTTISSTTGHIKVNNGSAYGKLTVSTSSPSGGASGDIWFKYS